MEQQQKILTFWDHLEELRHVLFCNSQDLF